MEVRGLGGMEEKKGHKFKTTGEKKLCNKTPFASATDTKKSTEIINKSIPSSIMLQCCLCKQCNAVIYQSRFQLSSLGCSLW